METDYLIILGGYMFGSISTAIIVCKLMGLPDPRTQGSKNPGATNVARLGGKKAAALTLLGDMLKGLVPVLIAHCNGPRRHLRPVLAGRPVDHGDLAGHGRGISLFITCGTGCHPANATLVPVADAGTGNYRCHVSPDGTALLAASEQYQESDFRGRRQD